MDFEQYVTHLDAVIRDSEQSENVESVRWESTTAVWDYDERSVRAQQNGTELIQFALHRGGEFAEDRFQDKIKSPDFQSTARQIVDFLNSETETT
jgi:hypothetical protein